MALADIEDRHYITGFSPSLGARQRIDGRCLANLYAFALAFYLRFGYPLVITEGARTRVRQKYLRQLYEAYLRGGPWAALAAILYTSRHDEVNNPNAIDFGSGIASRQTSASVWAHQNGPKYGISFTISTEPWHGEISYSTTSTAGNAGVTPIAAEAEYDDMKRVSDGEAIYLVGGTNITHISGPENEALATAGIPLVILDLPKVQAIEGAMRRLNAPGLGSALDALFQNIPSTVWAHHLKRGEHDAAVPEWFLNVSDMVGSIQRGLTVLGFTPEQILAISGEIGKHLPASTLTAAKVADEIDARERKRLAQ